jgi:glycosyltransferase involved in cell wall biosynthesis
VLSLCMIVKNEQGVLDRCLTSAREAVDEIVVVDTGSTDDSIEIARDHGATVLHHDFTDLDFTDLDFAGARNRSLEAARGDFALVLDADETLHPDSAGLVRLLAAEKQSAGYVVNRHNRRDGERTTVDHAVRLFARRPGFRYRNRVHETIDTAIIESGGRLRRSHVIIEHHLPTIERTAEKNRLYLRLLELDLADDPDDVDRLTFLAAEHHKLGDYRSATEVAERIAGLLPDDFGAHLTLALYHFAYGGDRAQARRSVRTALRLRPRDPEAYALWTALEEQQEHQGVAGPRGQHGVGIGRGGEDADQAPLGGMTPSGPVGPQDERLGMPAAGDHRAEAIGLKRQDA